MLLFFLAQFEVEMKLTSQKKAFLCLKLAGFMAKNAAYCLDISMVIYRVK